MNKRQLWAVLKEITSVIDGWDDEMYEGSKDNLMFAKYLPRTGDWNNFKKCVIKIIIDTEENDEKETERTGKSSQSA